MSECQRFEKGREKPEIIISLLVYHESTKSEEVSQSKTETNCKLNPRITKGQGFAKIMTNLVPKIIILSTYPLKINHIHVF